MRVVGTDILHLQGLEERVAGRELRHKGPEQGEYECVKCPCLHRLGWGWGSISSCQLGVVVNGTGLVWSWSTTSRD